MASARARRASSPVTPRRARSPALPPVASEPWAGVGIARPVGDQLRGRPGPTTAAAAGRSPPPRAGPTRAAGAGSRWGCSSPGTGYGYVHLFGTPSGRFGDARLARTTPRVCRSPPRTRDWTASGRRAGAQDDAVVVMPAPPGGRTTRTWASGWRSPGRIAHRDRGAHRGPRRARGATGRPCPPPRPLRRLPPPGDHRIGGVPHHVEVDPYTSC